MLEFVLVGFCIISSIILAISIFTSLAGDFFNADISCGVAPETAFYWFVLACALYYMAKLMGVL